MVIRPARQEDYVGIARAAEAAFPGMPHSAEEMREEDSEIAPPLKFERWVAEVEGKVVGSASYFQVAGRYHPQKFWMDQHVDPAYQGKGVGTALLERLLNTLSAYDPISLRSFTPVTAEQFERAQMVNSRFLPEGQFIARDGERWIAMSTIWKGTEPGTYNTGLTGTLREYRGRGIALALKLRGLAFTRSFGCTRLITHNASTNRPMLAINEQLGFTKEPAWLHLMKEFGDW